MLIRDTFGTPTSPLIRVPVGDGYIKGTYNDKVPYVILKVHTTINVPYVILKVHTMIKIHM